MSRPKIRHIATSYDGKMMAAGEFTKHVHTWDMERREKVAEFDSVLEFGGSRLAISNNGQWCAAGAYDGASLAENRYVGGSVALHDASSGKMLWQNKKIKRVQSLKFSMHWPELLLAGFSDQPLLVVDAENGSILRKIRGVRHVYESPHEAIQFRESDSDYALFDSKNDREIGRLKRHIFSSTLDVSFSETYVLVSEAAGPVTCYELRSCSQVWQHLPEEGHHLLEVQYNEKTSEFVAVDLQYEKGSGSALVWLDETTGLVKRKVLLSGTPWVTGFAARGTLLITSDGILIDTSNGKEIANLSFPRETD